VEPIEFNTPDNAGRATSLARAALRLAESDRDAFVVRECGHDPDLMSRVRVLLGAADMATCPSAASVPAAGAVSVHVAGSETGAARSGVSRGHITRLGAYTVMGILGEGGMGTVYIAEQDRPRRTVALKVMRAGIMSRPMLRRFEHESQMLARLQHPGIAQIYEASTADTGQGPQPFFAMEYVKGRTLLEHAFAARLDTRERLELFVRICDAVHHAHQKGVIHRDLKPANIVVDSTGQPKVLDFGIARSTDADMQTATLHTQAGQLVGTVPYMSPEQISGDPTAVDTRSDVYSLGVILYQLLTGRLPHAVTDKPIAMAAQMIQHDEPARLETVDRSLRGDVQTIVSKALEKERGRRYQSASDLGADLQRYLRFEPISARPPSRVYLVGKFARRNRALVGGVVAVTLALIGGSVATAWQAMKAMEGMRLAEARKRDADSSMKRAMAEAENAKGVNRFLTEMLEAANPDEGNSRDVSVLEMVDRAAAKLKEDADTSDWVSLSLHNTLSNTYRAMGKPVAAIEQAERAVAVAKALYGDRNVETVTAKRTLAMAVGELAEFERCEVLTRECVDTLRELVGESDPEYVLTLAELARVLHQRGKYEQSEPLLRECKTKLIAIFGTRYRDTLTTMDHLGITLLQQSKFEEAITQLREVLALREEVFGARSSVTAFTLNNLANALQKSGKNDEAIEMLTRVVEIRRERLNADHPSLLVSMNNLAVALTTGGRLAEAEPLLRESMQSQMRMLGEQHPKTMLAMGNLAFVLEDQNKLDEAEQLFRRVVELRRSVSLEDPEAWPQMNNLAMLLVKQGKLEEAAALYAELVAICQQHAPPGYAAGAIFRNNYGECLSKLKRFEQAEELLKASQDDLVRIFKDGHPRVQRGAQRLAAMYRAWGKEDAALEWEARIAKR
jgi:tetratricopeptide (TPR) repeat protein